MTVLFSKKCELGIQAVLFLSTQEPNIPFNAGYIAKKIIKSKEFVSKVLQKLAVAGIVKSQKGKEGGFFLAKLPSKIKLVDIVKSIDGNDIFNSCVLGFVNCSPKSPCPVHHKWEKIRKEIIDLLSKETLEQLKKDTENKIKYLSSNIKK